MADFGADTFEKAAGLLSSIFHACLRNIDSLKAERAVIARHEDRAIRWLVVRVLVRRRLLAKLTAIDAGALRELLCQDEGGTKTYCLIGGVAGGTMIDSKGEEQRFLLNTDILQANTTLAMLRSGKVGVRSAVPHLGNLYDAIALRSLALSELFAHLARVAAAPDAGRFILTLAGIVNRDDPLDEARKAAADRTLNELIRQYVHGLDRAATDLAARAFGPEHMKELRAGMYLNQTPIWHTEIDAPGSRVINDVWLPERHATPLMADIARQQAAAMTQR